MTALLINRVRGGFYMDSVGLMRFSRTIVDLDGIKDAALMMGTPANKEIMANAGLLDKDGETAEPGDLIIGVRATDGTAMDGALAEIDRLLDQPTGARTQGTAWRPRTVRAAIQANPAANFALISVPGDFAAGEARKALRRGLHVMVFSDNVPVEQEIALKREARDLGLLMMGPDCGTAIINGLPIAFANKVTRGNIGIVGASGTGIQEVSTLISRHGGGISHAIGVGGRDLSKAVGGITSLMAIDALEADDATAHIVVISKPPAAAVAERVIDRLKQGSKPATICFIGAETSPGNDTLNFVSTLREAAISALGDQPFETAVTPGIRIPAGRRSVRGLYSGGTLAAEAQLVFLKAGLAVASNAPVPGAAPLGSTGTPHHMIDLGEDQYTRGRPHPMIEPAIREEPLREAMDDPSVGIILMDVVLGFGAHPDPAGQLVEILAPLTKPGGPVLIAAVTGTEQDPQRYGAQVGKLRQAGITVASCNADAAALAVTLLGDNSER
ncbi:MAG: acyl-CoA synthetase FdrA [Rhodospirillaceae bacterium]|jgi:FdrA protein|nr:acyl-CoA synthetase FdrA [Rhodospirillaceae bacterium]